MKTNLLFSTYRVDNPAIAEQPFWLGKPILGTSVSTGQIAQAVAAERGMPPEDVLYVYRRTNEIAIDMLREGRNVNLELVGYSINLTGKFASKDDPFKASQNMLEVSAYAKPILRNCLTSITPRNVTNGLKAHIYSVTDDQAYLDGVITAPSRVLVSGKDILIDDRNVDEGVWLLAADGEIVAMPTVLANTVATLDLDFGELPPDGEYTLVVKARSGAPADYQSAVVRKAVTIRNA